MGCAQSSTGKKEGKGRAVKAKFSKKGSKKKEEATHSSGAFDGVMGELSSSNLEASRSGRRRKAGKKSRNGRSGDDTVGSGSTSDATFSDDATPKSSIGSSTSLRRMPSRSGVKHSKRYLLKSKGDDHPIFVNDLPTDSARVSWFIADPTPVTVKVLITTISAKLNRHWHARDPLAAAIVRRTSQTRVPKEMDEPWGMVLDLSGKSLRYWIGSRHCLPDRNHNVSRSITPTTASPVGWGTTNSRSFSTSFGSSRSRSFGSNIGPIPPGEVPGIWITPQTFEGDAAEAITAPDPAVPPALRKEYEEALEEATGPPPSPLTAAAIAAPNPLQIPAPPSPTGTKQEPAHGRSKGTSSLSVQA